MSSHDNLWCEDDRLTNNSVTVLGDIILDGLFPAEGLLNINFNTNIARNASPVTNVFRNGTANDHDTSFFDFCDPFVG